MPLAPPSPAERFADILHGLDEAVAARSGSERLVLSLIALIIDFLRDIAECFARLAADADLLRRPPVTPRRHRATQQPRQRSPLPKKMRMLRPPVPEAVGHDAQREPQSTTPATTAPIAAAPARMARPPPARACGPPPPHPEGAARTHAHFVTISKRYHGRANPHPRLRVTSRPARAAVAPSPHTYVLCPFTQVCRIPSATRVGASKSAVSRTVSGSNSTRSA